MKARKEGTAQKMEDEGKDTSVLSGKRRDIVRSPVPLNLAWTKLKQVGVPGASK